MLSTVKELVQADEDSSDDDLPVGSLNEPRTKATDTEICESIKKMRQKDPAGFKNQTLKQIRDALTKEYRHDMGTFKKQIKLYVKEEVAKLA